MATRAFSFSKEYSLSTFRIPVQSVRLKLALERPHISDHSARLGFTKIAEGGHARPRHSIRNNRGKLRVGQLANLGTSRNVHGFVASAAIESMATGARTVVYPS